MYQQVAPEVTTATVAELLEDTREALDSLPVSEFIRSQDRQMLFKLSNDYYILVGPETDCPWIELGWVLPALPGADSDWDFKVEDRGSILLTHFWVHQQ